MATIRSMERCSFSIRSIQSSKFRRSHAPFFVAGNSLARRFQTWHSSPPVWQECPAGAAALDLHLCDGACGHRPRRCAPPSGSLEPWWPQPLLVLKCNALFLARKAALPAPALRAVGREYKAEAAADRQAHSHPPSGATGIAEGRIRQRHEGTNRAEASKLHLVTPVCTPSFPRISRNRRRRSE